MSSPPLSLDPSSLIGAGAYCKCYLHPSDSTQCIKLPTDEAKAPKRLAADLAYSRKLHRQKADLSHIADYLGSCETNLGTGHLYQHIHDHDGLTSKTLSHYLEHQPELAEILTAQLIILRDYLLENLILISDLHGRNILVQFTTPDQPQLVLVDGIGDRVFITFPNLIHSVRRGKITRRWNRFMRNLKREHPSSAHQFPMLQAH